MATLSELKKMQADFDAERQKTEHLTGGDIIKLSKDGDTATGVVVFPAKRFLFVAVPKNGQTVLVPYDPAEHATLQAKAYFFYNIVSFGKGDDGYDYSSGRGRILRLNEGMGMALAEKVASTLGNIKGGGDTNTILTTIKIIKMKPWTYDISVIPIAALGGKEDEAKAAASVTTAKLPELILSNIYRQQEG